MSSSRWTSKLERVVSFKLFKNVYNIDFTNSGSLVYKDSAEQVYFMLTKLIDDLIDLPATGNFRTKDNFKDYTDKLEPKYKSQYIATNDENEQDENEQENAEKHESSDSHETSTNTGKETTEKGPNDNEESHEDNENMEPKPISKKHRIGRKALKLSKEYSEEQYTCLGEKGKEILVELESINICNYPNASAALCRSILEYTVKLWLMESKHPEQFKEGSLPDSYNSCLNDLANRKILNDKQHKMLKRCANKEYFIDFLNSCIHADSKICVQEQALIDGWKTIRILTELYIEGPKK